MTCGADALGTTLNDSLTTDVPYVTPAVSLDTADYNIPTASQLTEPIVKLTNEDLSTGVVNGTGSFDTLMTGFSAHLDKEYKANRITGAEYTKAFIALTESAMAQGASYLVQRDRQYWDLQLIQQQAELTEVQVATSKIKLETAKVEHAVTQLQALNLEAEYATKKLQMSLLSSQFCISEFELNDMLPRKLAMLNEQVSGQTIANSTATYNLSNILPKQYAMLTEQVTGQTTANSIAAYNLSKILPEQYAMLREQVAGQTKANSTADYNLSSILPTQFALLKEQHEAARAQTLNTRYDGAAVEGTLGAQRKLHDQQVQSYIQDTRIKVSKMYNDLWVTYVTINDELLASDTTWPSQLRSDQVGSVLANLRSGVSL